MKEKESGKSTFWLVMTIIVVMIFFYMLCSCSPQKKLSRLIKKYPELRQLDTLTISDTTIVESNSTDTVFKPGTDTVIIKEGRLTIKHFYHDSTVFLSGECETDTIIKIINVPLEIPHTENTWKEDLKKYGLFLAGFLFVMLLMFIGFVAFRK